MSRGQGEEGSVTGRGVLQWWQAVGGEGQAVTGSCSQWQKAGKGQRLQAVTGGWGSGRQCRRFFLGKTEGERQRQGVAASGVGGGDEKDHMFSRKEEMDCSASNEQFGRKNNTAGVVHCKKKGRKNEHMDSPHTKEQKHAH